MTLFSEEHAHEVFKELEDRYNRINISTLQDLLSGKRKAEKKTKQFSVKEYSAPELAEVKAAFWDYNCVILTAFRSGRSLYDNLQENEKLKSKMRVEGLKFRPVKGCYRQADWEVPVEEHSFFLCNIDGIPSNDFFVTAYKLSRDAQQDSFLYARGGLNEYAYLIATNEKARNSSPFKGSDIKDAGRFYEHVPDVGDWTACQGDDRFAFQSREMVLIESGHNKLSYGLGNIFDINGYHPNGIIVIRHSDEEDIEKACKEYSGKIPLFCHVLINRNQTEEYIHKIVIRYLNLALNNHCKRICLFCTASINDSYLDGAKVVHKTVISWIIKYGKKIKRVILHDTYGNYAKFDLLSPQYKE